MREWANRHPAANIGIIWPAWGVTIVDVDDPQILDAVITRFGDSPIRFRRRGAAHLCYRSSGEPASTSARRSRRGREGPRRDYRLSAFGAAERRVRRLRSMSSPPARGRASKDLPTIKQGALAPAAVVTPLCRRHGRRNKKPLLKHCCCQVGIGQIWDHDRRSPHHRRKPVESPAIRSPSAEIVGCSGRLGASRSRQQLRAGREQSLMCRPPCSNWTQAPVGCSWCCARTLGTPEVRRVAGGDGRGRRNPRLGETAIPMRTPNASRPRLPRAGPSGRQ